MMEEKKLVPKRRFVGFDKEWQESKLGDVVNYIVDNRGKNPSYYCNEGIPIIDNFMIKNIPYPNLNEAVRYIDENLYVNFIREYNELNDVLITLVGNGIGNITLFPNKKSAIIQNTLGLRFNENKKFMFYLMLSINKEIILLNRGMAQPNIRQDELLDINIKIPFTNEQQKIGEFFKVLDERIANQERKIAKVKALKTAYLTEMFPQEGESVPKRRFKEFQGEWKDILLEEALDYEQPNSYIVDEEDYSDKFTTPVLTAGQSFLLGFTQETHGIKNASLDNPVVIFDDFTTSSHFVDFSFKVKSSALKILIPDKNKYNSYFLYQVLKNIDYKPKNHERHWISIFSSFTVKVPAKSEQKKIGEFFKNLDDQIATEEKKLAKLKKMKEAYLEEMFV